MILCALFLSIVHAQLTFVSGYNKNVTSWRLEEDGKLTYLASSNGIVNPSWMTWSKDKKFMYAVNEVGAPSGGNVAAFSIDYTTKTLKFINLVPSGGSSPPFVSIHSSGVWCFVANYDDGYISIFPVDPVQGSLGNFVYNENHGEEAHMMIEDPGDPQFVFVPYKASDYIGQYIFDDKTGKLLPNPVAPVIYTAPGAGPRHIAFHPTRKWAFVVTELASTVITYSYNVLTGVLTSQHVISTLPPNFNGSNTGAEILVSPSGLFVYASNRGHNSIAIFKVDVHTGLLMAIGWETAHGKINTPRGVTLDQEGKRMLVASQATNIVTTFLVDANDGLLKEVMTVSVASQPSFIGVLPY